MKICNWLSWSDSYYTMHDNVPGKAADTKLGEVVRNDSQEKPWGAFLGLELVGRFATCDDAKREVMKRAEVCELDNHHGG